MYEGQFFARFRKSDGICASKCRRRSWSFVALACAFALLTGCVVRYAVLSYPPDSVSLPYYAGRSAVVIYLPLSDSTYVDSLYLYRWEGL